MSPPPFVGLCLALAAAAGNNLGKGLQKAATANLPALNLARKEVVCSYLSSPTWLLGLALDVGGGGAMLGALAAAPVSLVQPVAAFGLVLLAGFSHFVLQERLGPQQWRGAAVATLGIIGMGISSSSSSSDDVYPTAAAAAGQTLAAAGMTQQPLNPAVPEQQLSPARVLSCFVLLLLLLGVVVWWRQQRERAAAARRKRAGAAAGVGAVAAAEAAAAAADAAACGLEAGCCFGFSAAAARTGFELSKTLGWLFVPVGLAASVCLTSSGFVLQTRGFKHGSALVVCTTAAAASIVAGVLVGLVALSEPLPSSPRLRLLLVASWAAVFAGISSMAGSRNDDNNMAPDKHSGSGSTGGNHHHHHHHHQGLGVVDRVQGLVRELLLLLPRDVRRRVLPRRTQQWLGRSGGASSSGGGSGFWPLLGYKGGGLGKGGGGYADGSSGQQQVQGLGGAGGSGGVLCDDGGPVLPVSSSTPDFGAVLAPLGGTRRS